MDDRDNPYSPPQTSPIKSVVDPSPAPPEDDDDEPITWFARIRAFVIGVIILAPIGMPLAYAIGVAYDWLKQWLLSQF